MDVSDNNTCTTNNISLNTGIGIWLDSSVNNTFSHNIFSGNSWGMRLTSSPDNYLLKNNMTSTSRLGIYLESSGNMRLINNSFYNAGLYVLGSQLTDYLQREVTNNYVNDKPFIYWHGIL